MSVQKKNSWGAISYLNLTGYLRKSIVCPKGILKRGSRTPRTNWKPLLDTNSEKIHLQGTKAARGEGTLQYIYRGVALNDKIPKINITK